MVNKEEILSFLQEKKVDFFSDYQLVKLGLFGSYATGNAKPNSDIDIIVEFKPHTEDLFEKKSNLKSVLRDKFKLEIDVCTEKYIKPYFKTQILETVIYV